MTRGSGLEQVAATLRSRSSFLLAAQIGADGDRLGSLVALAGALRKLGKRVVAYCDEPLPEPCREIPGIEGLVGSLGGEATFDAAILLKCPSASRFPTGLEPRRRAACLVNVDHNPSNEAYGDVNWVDPGFAAAGEMVQDLIEALGVELDADLARALYIAVFTATGSFQFAGVGAATHRRAARLLEFGIPTDRIGRVFLRENDFRALKLLGGVLSRLEVTGDGRLAWAQLALPEVRGEGLRPEDTGWFVDTLDQLQGVRVAVLFRELADGRVKVSFRSKQTPIHELAARFGGGGLPGAAACVVAGNLEEVRQRVLAELSSVVGACPAPRHLS